MNEPLTPDDRASAEGLREAIDAALHELGEPGPGYPAPVANAVDILRAALRDTGPRPDSGIDVERLAEALHESDLMRRYSEYADAVPTMTPTPEHTLCIEWAAIIAREYARLSTPRTERRNHDAGLHITPVQTCEQCATPDRADPPGS